MPKTSTAEKDGSVKIKRPRWDRMVVRAEGLSPLVMDRYAMDDDEVPTERATEKEKAAYRALHRLEAPENGSLYGVPARALKALAVSAGRWSSYPMTELRGAIFVPAAGADGLVPIEHGDGYKIWSRPVPKEASGKGSVIKHSPVFESWGIEIVVDYMANFISKEDVLSLFAIGGRSVGLGSCAPRSKGSGPYGTFEVTNYADVPKHKEAK